MIELLIVVVVIGVLAMIVYPQYEGMRIRARLRDIYSTVEVIKAAEKYYYAKKNAWYEFNKNGTNSANTYAAAENALRITLPDSSEALYAYAVDQDATSGYEVAMAFCPPNGSLLYWYVLPDGPSWKNSSHQYTKYITAENEASL